MTTPPRYLLAAAFAAPALFLMTTLAPLSAEGPAGAVESGTLTVTVKYTGTGLVDDGHRLWLWIFDSPEFGSGAVPIREESISTNGDSIIVGGLTEKRVWIVAAYDERGGFPGSAPPPSGSPIGVYSADGRGPSALTLTEEVTALVTFGDARRMP